MQGDLEKQPYEYYNIRQASHGDVGLCASGRYCVGQRELRYEAQLQGACVCVCVRGRAGVRACAGVRAGGRACVRLSLFLSLSLSLSLSVSVSVSVSVCFVVCLCVS